MPISVWIPLRFCNATCNVPSTIKGCDDGKLDDDQETIGIASRKVQIGNHLRSQHSGGY